MSIPTSKKPPVVSVIGAGPAGLMAAEALRGQGLQVDVYDAMPSAGRKFLLAGKGGLNISHSEPKDRFLSRYGTRQDQLKPMLEAFGPEALIDWVHGLGVNTFVGTSGRIFPAEMKAAPLLRAWLHRLRSSGVNFHMRHQWLGWCDGDYRLLRFLTVDGERHIRADAVVLALGGASWPKLGSTGAWVHALQQQGVPVAPLRPANCGFDVNWSEYFRHRFAGEPLKSVVISFTNRQGAAFSRKGELIITEKGVEGGVIYALSALLRDEIAASGEVVIHIDLVPDQNMQALVDKVSAPRGKLSMANHLRKRIGVDGVKAGCVREIVSKSDFEDPVRLCSLIKALPVRLVSARPIVEAISSAGGISFEALDDRLMIRAMPGVFCAGEMMDWEAPTGGYLLTACFASGRRAGNGVLAWFRANGTIRIKR